MSWRSSPWRAGAVTLLLVLCTTTVQAEEAWETPILDVTRLEEARTAAKGAQKAAAESGAEDASALAAAQERRAGLLDRLIAVVATGQALPATEAQIQAQVTAVNRTLADAASATDPAEGLPPIRSETDLEPFSQARQAAEADLARARTRLQRATRAQAEVQAAPDPKTGERVSALEAEVATPLPEGATPLQHVQRGNATLELRLLRAVQALADAAARVDAWRSLAALQEQAAEAALRQATNRYDAAQSALTTHQEQDVDRARTQAAALETQAAAIEDPLERFVALRRAERARLRYQALRTQRMATEAEGWRVRETQRLERLDKERQGLEARFSNTERGSARTGALLRNTLRRLRRARERLERTEIPEIDGALEWIQGTRAYVQDRLWEVEGLVLEENGAWLALEEDLGDASPETLDAARRAFREQLFGVGGVVPALREHLDRLGKAQQGVSEASRLAWKRQGELDTLQGWLIQHIYWVRTDDPVSLTTLRDVPDEVARIGRFYSREGALGAFVTSVREAPSRYLMEVLILLVGLGVLLFLRRHRDALRLKWLDRGSEPRKALQHTLAALGGAALPPFLIWITARLLPVDGAAGLLLRPAATLMELGAYAWFFRRAARRFLGPEGVALRHYRLAPDIAAQLLRSVRWITAAYAFFYVPRGVLLSAPFDAPPLEITHLPRLLYTAFLLVMAISLSRLVLRNRPLMRRLLSRSRVLHGLWGVVGPVLILVFFGIVVMDALGYRIGAAFLLENVASTAVAVVLLAVLYMFLRRFVHWMAGRVLEKGAADGNTKQARRMSGVVLDQLTRVVTTIMFVVSALLLARFWGVDTALSSFFGQLQITEVSDGVWLTVWDLLQAVAWIAGAHFLARNLGGVLEFLVFSVVGGAEPGGRYVLAALMRYAILILGYSAALLALNFSFSSIGWLLAALSVGLGFGLQEIVANFVSGLILLLERPVRVGDTISVGDTWGDIDKISARATVVTSTEGRVVIIPNKDLITSTVINWTRNNNLVRWNADVGVAYGTDVEAVLRILKEAVEANKDVANKPRWEINFVGFGASSLDFSIWYYAPHGGRGRAVRTALYQDIHRRLAEAGIEIPFPQRDLHIRSGLPSGNDPAPDTDD